MKAEFVPRTSRTRWEMRPLAEGLPPVIAGTKPDGTTLYLESPEAPAAEVEDFAAANQQRIGVVVVPPCSVSTIEALASRIPRLKKIVVVDYDEERLAAWRRAVGGHFNGKVAQILLSPDRGTIETALRSFLNEEFHIDVCLGRCRCYFPRRYRRVEKDFCDSLELALYNVLRGGCTSAAHGVTRDWHRILNEIVNHRLPGRWRLAGARGAPVVVVGAGPSLDDTAPVLAKFQDRAVIIAVDTAASALLANGVRPDIIASIEDVHRAFSLAFMPILDQLVDIPVAIPRQASHLTARSYPGPIVFTANSRSVWPLPGDCPSVERGRCVGHYAFNLAKCLEPSEIIMLGFDLSFREGEIHSRRLASKYYERVASSADVVKVPGANGGELDTDFGMYTYLRDFEVMIAECPLPVYNATVGGALIRGAAIGGLESRLANAEPANKSLAAPNNAAASTDDGLIFRLPKLAAAIALAREAAAKMTPASISNPLFDIDTQSREFALVSSCANVIVMEEFADALQNHRSIPFEEYHRLLSAALGELDYTLGFVQSAAAVAEYDGGNSDNSIYLSPDGQPPSGSAAAVLADKKTITMPASSGLPEIWNAVIENQASLLLAVNGDIVPDAWTAPNITCIDIREQTSVGSFDKLLWLPGYSIVCPDPATAQWWRENCPPEIPCAATAWDQTPAN